MAKTPNPPAAPVELKPAPPPAPPAVVPRVTYTTIEGITTVIAAPAAAAAPTPTEENE